MTDDIRARFAAVLDHWLAPLPPGVREGLTDDLTEAVAAHLRARAEEQDGPPADALRHEADLLDPEGDR